MSLEAPADADTFLSSFGAETSLRPARAGPPAPTELSIAFRSNWPAPAPPRPLADSGDAGCSLASRVSLESESLRKSNRCGLRNRGVQRPSVSMAEDAAAVERRPHSHARARATLHPGRVSATPSTSPPASALRRRQASARGRGGLQGSFSPQMVCLAPLPITAPQRLAPHCTRHRRWLGA